MNNPIQTTEKEKPGLTASPSNPSVKIWAGWLVGVLLLASATNLASTGFASLENWFSFVGVTLLAACVLFAGVWLLRGENLPHKLIVLVVAAAVLRLLQRRRKRQLHSPARVEQRRRSS